MNNTNNCTIITVIYELDNILAFFISFFIIGTVFFIVDNLTRFRWKIKDRHFCSKKRNNWGVWIKYYTGYIIFFILLSFTVKKLVYLIII